MKQTNALIRLLFLFLIGGNSTYAQLISGNVYDEKTGEPVVGASIFFDAQTGVSSGKTGEFILSVPSGKSKFELQIRSIGYENFSRTLFREDDNKNLRLYLTPSFSTLKQVVVSAGRFAQNRNEVSVSMEVLRQEAITNNNSVSLDDALNRLPGINTVRGQLNMRGSGYSYGVGSRVMMLTDDLPFLTADGGDIRWLLLPNENIEQVEVIKGAASALYGSNALSGIIHYRTAMPGNVPKTTITLFNTFYDNPPLPHLRPWGDQPNPVMNGISFSHSQRYGRFSLIASAGFINDQGYRIGEKSMRGQFSTHMRYDTKVKGLSFGLNLAGMVDSNRIFTFWENNIMGWAPAPLSVNNQLHHRFTIDPYIVWVPNQKEKHSFRNRIYRNELEFDQPRERSYGTMYYSEYQYQRKMDWGNAGNSTLTTGFLNQYNQIGSDRLYGNRDSRNHAIYLQYDHKVGRLSVNVGGRYEYYDIENGSRTLNYPVFRSGINFRIFKNTWLRAMYGEGVRVPSIAEMYGKSYVGTSYILPNADLLPERSWAYEGGIRKVFRMGGWEGSADACYFSTDFSNMIEYRLGVRSVGLSFMPTNIVNAQIYGAEVSTQLNGNFGPVRLRFTAGYTYVMPYDKSPDFDFFAGLPDTIVKALSIVPDRLKRILPYRYQHLIRSDLELSYKHMSVGCNFRYNSVMVNIENIYYGISAANLIGTGLLEERLRGINGDMVFDFRLNYKIDGMWRLGLVVRNAFNRAVMLMPFNMAEQRNVVVQLTCRL